jgi:hypothetical protein
MATDQVPLPSSTTSDIPTDVVPATATPTDQVTFTPSTIPSGTQ